MKLNKALIALLISSLSGLAYAAEVDSTKRIDKRQEAQQERIDKAAKSRDLTKKEAARLEQRQDRIDAAEKKAARDGKVTATEKKRIETMQDKQDRRIRAQSGDKQRVDRNRPNASAGTSSATSIEQRQAEQRKAFEQGQQAGRYSPDESALLHRNQVRIQAAESEAKADGTVTASERARIEAMQNEQQRLLDRQR